jgi:hypothetical protein
MQVCGWKWCGAVFLLIALGVAAAQALSGESALPEFGRDTVLVYNIQNLDYSANFVIRIAQFLPDRYFEWEDELSQGTVFIPGRDIDSSKGYVNSNLFKSGSDTRGSSSTTVWLSRQIFSELKAKKKVKCMINGTPGAFTYQGEDTFAVEVNRTSRVLPVIKVMDDRKEERLFLNQEDNPLMLSHRFRKFSQTLTSITTDKSNTLRWIKGRKLENPPR